MKPPSQARSLTVVEGKLLPPTGGPVGGYRPEELDRRIQGLVKTLETFEGRKQPVIERVIDRLAAQVERWPDDGDARVEAEGLAECWQLTNMLERLQRGRTQSVKALVEMTRLRVYLTQQERQAETSMGDLSDAELLARIRRVMGDKAGEEQESE